MKKIKVTLCDKLGSDTFTVSESGFPDNLISAMRRKAMSEPIDNADYMTRVSKHIKDFLNLSINAESADSFYFDLLMHDLIILE